MRVRVGPDRVSRDDDGAVAVIVAILLVVLIGMAAFAVDGGVAYNSKRQLQTSADAAAAAPAAVYLGEPGDCADLAAHSGLRGDAQKAATEMMNSNHSSASQAEFDVYCDADDRITVTFTNDAVVDAKFGGVLGVDTLNPVAKAVANIGEREGQGIRPIGVCGDEVPSGGAGLTRAEFNKDSDPIEPDDAGCEQFSGNWRELDCPEVDNNGSKQYAGFINQGCSDPVRPVPDQPPKEDPGLRQHLLDACPAPGDSNEVCLGGNTGDPLGGAKILDAWEELLGETVSVPIICDTTDCPGPPDGGWEGNGNNSLFPIHQIGEVVVCGLHRQNKDPIFDTTNPACSSADTLDPGENMNEWLIFNFIRVIDWDDPDAEVGPSESVQLVE